MLLPFTHSLNHSFTLHGFIGRFANRKSGHKANWYAQTYGEKLLPDLFAHLNPMTHQRALEIALAEELRQEGFAVW